MRTKLSSDWTYFSKWVAPPAFGGAAVLSLAQTLRHPHGQNSGDYLFAAVWGVAALAACWYGLRLKHVVVDERFLYVSNYVGDVALPLSGIVGVREKIIAPHIRSVIIYLSEPSAFGRRIMFEPSLGSYFSFKASPAFIELRKIVRQNLRAPTKVGHALLSCGLAALTCAAVVVASPARGAAREGLVAAASQRGGRIRPPEGLKCDPNRLTSFTGRVTSYRRNASSVSLRMRTDEATNERFTLRTGTREGAAKHFLIEGEPFKAADWKRIERGPGRLRARMRATVWACEDNSTPPVVDWRPGGKSPGTVY